MQRSKTLETLQAHGAASSVLSVHTQLRAPLASQEIWSSGKEEWPRTTTAATQAQLQDRWPLAQSSLFALSKRPSTTLSVSTQKPLSRYGGGEKDRLQSQFATAQSIEANFSTLAERPE